MSIENGFTLKKKAKSKWYPTEIIADDLQLHSNTPAQVKFLLHGLEQATRGIDHYVSPVYVFKRRSHLHSKWQASKISRPVVYLGSNISSTESDVNIHIGNSWTAIDRLLTIWKSDLSNKIKEEFFQAIVC